MVLPVPDCIPVGYRLLGADEYIQKDDLYYSTSKQWEMTPVYGMKPNKESKVCFIRLDKKTFFIEIKKSGVKVFNCLLCGYSSKDEQVLTNKHCYGCGVQHID